MTKKFFLLLALLLLASSFAFAQTPGNNASGGNWAVPIGAGISMAIASGLCGLGQGNAVGKASEAMARNPAVAGVIRGSLLLGLVFIESLALYTLVIVFVKVS
ncbi:MAG: ATP synthase F0 subunit C [Bryobacteraceae bacterium]